MRFSKLMLGVTGLGAMAVAAVGGCSSSTSGGGSGAGATTGCEPKASCTAVEKTCLGLTENKGLTKFGLRIAELDLNSPAALTNGVVKGAVSGGVTADDKACNLDGSGTFNWIIQFDTMAKTIKTGGARPVADATKGYSFDMETFTQGGKMFNVAPVTFTNISPDASGNFAITTGTDLVVPIFLDSAGSSVVILPLHQARLLMGTLSSDQDCIGSYNGANLDPANNCQPDSTHNQFNAGGKLDGYITLEEADTVVVSALNQSLCVLLSGNAAMYGMTPAGSKTAVCDRDSMGKIVYQGGWCSTTNSAGGCADSEQLAAGFAANSVLINN